jgi:hypothetical protein
MRIALQECHIDFTDRKDKVWSTPDNSGYNDRTKLARDCAQEAYNPCFEKKSEFPQPMSISQSNFR